MNDGGNGFKAIWVRLEDHSKDITDLERRMGSFEALHPPCTDWRKSVDKKLWILESKANRGLGGLMVLMIVLNIFMAIFLKYM